MDEASPLVNGWNLADPRAAEQLLPLVYDELRRLASQKLAQEKPGQTLNATALVHEAFLRLTAGRDRAGGALVWRDRVHFLHAAAEAMRRILIDNARKKQSEKRGGGRERVDDEPAAAPAQPREDVLAIDEAIQALAADDAESAQLVKLRFYAGLSVEEAGDALGLSRASAYRVWSFAKAWLRARLDGSFE